MRIYFIAMSGDVAEADHEAALRRAVGAVEFRTGRKVARAWMEEVPDPVKPSVPGMCGRVLVGQGTDQFDPVCVLDVGHGGSCSPVPQGPAASGEEGRS